VQHRMKKSNKSHPTHCNRAERPTVLQQCFGVGLFLP
jgi:hypothetical protein